MDISGWLHVSSSGQPVFSTSPSVSVPSSLPAFQATLWGGSVYITQQLRQTRPLWLVVVRNAVLFSILGFWGVRFDALER